MKLKSIVPKALLESLSVHFPRRRPDMLRHLRLHRHGYRRTMITLFISLPNSNTAVLSEAWAKLRDWASVAGRGRLLLSGSVAHASLKTAVGIKYI